MTQFSIRMTSQEVKRPFSDAMMSQIRTLQARAAERQQFLVSKGGDAIYSLSLPFLCSFYYVLSPFSVLQNITGCQLWKNIYCTQNSTAWIFAAMFHTYILICVQLTCERRETLISTLFLAVFAKMSILELGPTIFQPISGIVQWMQGKHLLASSKTCSTCNTAMVLSSRSDVSDGSRWFICII